MSAKGGALRSTPLHKEWLVRTRVPSAFISEPLRTSVSVISVIFSIRELRADCILRFRGEDTSHPSAIRQHRFIKPQEPLDLSTKQQTPHGCLGKPRKVMRSQCNAAMLQCSSRGPRGLSSGCGTSAR